MEPGCPLSVDTRVSAQHDQLEPFKERFNIDADVTEENTALANACLRNEIDCVIELVKKKENLNVSFDAGRTPLIWASENGFCSVVQALIQAGADLNKTDDSGRTALIWASNNGHDNCVVLLIEAGALVHVEDASGHTALARASACGKIGCLEALLNTEIKIQDCMAALMLADQNNLESCFRRLAKVVDSSGYTVLMQAVLEGNSELVLRLLRAGADVYQKNANGLTAADMAANKLNETDATGSDIGLHRLCAEKNLVQLESYPHLEEEIVKKDKHGYSALYYALQLHENYSSEDVLKAKEVAEILLRKDIPLPILADEKLKKTEFCKILETCVSKTMAVWLLEVLHRPIGREKSATDREESIKLIIEEVTSNTSEESAQENSQDSRRRILQAVAETEKKYHASNGSQGKEITECLRSKCGPNNTTAEILDGLETPICDCSCSMELERVLCELMVPVKDLFKVSCVQVCWLLMKFCISMLLIYYIDFTTDIAGAYEVSYIAGVSTTVKIVAWLLAFIPHLYLCFLLAHYRKRILFRASYNGVESYLLLQYPLIRALIVMNWKGKLVCFFLLLFQLWPAYMYLQLGQLILDLRHLRTTSPLRQKIIRALEKMKLELNVVGEVNTTAEATSQLLFYVWINYYTHFSNLIIFKLIVTPFFVTHCLFQSECQVEYPVDIGLEGSVLMRFSLLFRYSARFWLMVVFIKHYEYWILVPYFFNVVVVLLIRIFEEGPLKPQRNVRNSIKSIVWSRKTVLSVFHYFPRYPYENKMPRGSRFWYPVGLTLIDASIYVAMLLTNTRPHDMIWYWTSILAPVCHLLAWIFYLLYLQFGHPWKNWIKW